MEILPKFMVLLLDALDAPNPFTALTEAFSTIRKFRSQPGYEQENLQFERFMQEVGAHVPAGADTSRRDLLAIADVISIALVTELFPGGAGARDAALRVLFANTGLRYERIRADFEGEHAESSCAIRVLRDGVEIAVIPLEGGRQVKRIGRVISGTYAFELSTGLLLWKGELRRRDIEYASAFPGRALDLAAADNTSPQGTPTVGAPDKSTKTISLLGGALLARIYPGMEAGVLEFTIEGEVT